jgi:hypothetical protein
MQASARRNKAGFKNFKTDHLICTSRRQLFESLELLREHGLGGHVGHHVQAHLFGYGCV